MRRARGAQHLTLSMLQAPVKGLPQQTQTWGGRRWAYRLLHADGVTREKPPRAAGQCFRTAMRVVEEAFSATVSDSLVHLNVAGLAAVRRSLDIAPRWFCLQRIFRECIAASSDDASGRLVAEDPSAPRRHRLSKSNRWKRLFQVADFQSSGIELALLEIRTFADTTRPYTNVAEIPSVASKAVSANVGSRRCLPMLT